jgi:hypothetical protein
MEERDVLRHLLDVETNASTLVEEAQAEADRLVAEDDRKNRLQYDAKYAEAATALREAYKKEEAAIQADYDRQIDAYRKSLAAMTIRKEQFAALAGNLLNVSGEDARS